MTTLALTQTRDAAIAEAEASQHAAAVAGSYGGGAGGGARAGRGGPLLLRSRAPTQAADTAASAGRSSRSSGGGGGGGGSDASEDGSDDSDNSDDLASPFSMAVSRFLKEHESAVFFCCGDALLNPVPCFAAARVAPGLVAGFMGGITYT